ncbi:hypothetical protein FLM48_06835 [Shewanella sp. Scap07]|uniref:hypothetical protein n=1 Tax=Shewanella sp. Scap07 TaxID=2589987 RepID=UPI0015B9ECD0|nr:hypothetical protein [Shewanella sp. Scap07]QLE84825.1 hypothetical protein FLM48_06835 [Shewanella sp. Scap07]
MPPTPSAVSTLGLVSLRFTLIFREKHGFWVRYYIYEREAWMPRIGHAVEGLSRIYNWNYYLFDLAWQQRIRVAKDLALGTDL